MEEVGDDVICLFCKWAVPIRPATGREVGSDHVVKDVIAEQMWDALDGTIGEDPQS